MPNKRISRRKPRGAVLLSDRAWQEIARTLGITKRKLQIVQAVFDNQHEADIAKRFKLSPHTIHMHLNRLFKKLTVTSRAGLVLRMVEQMVKLTSSSNLVLMVDACTNMVNPVWLPVTTNTLNPVIGTNCIAWFSEPQRINYPGRFKRLRSLQVFTSKNMQTKRNLILTGLLRAALLTATLNSFGQDARFFRISGPAETKILAFQTDGTLVWSNALPGANYTVQVATTLDGGTNWLDYVQLPVTSSVNTNRLVDYNPPAIMALIPAGSFTMGDCMVPSEGYGYETPLHSVYVSGFYMDRYEVTYSQWQRVYYWAITNGYNFDNAGAGKAANHPVQMVDWYDCVKWCNARSEMEGRTPAYYTNSAQTTVYRTGLVDLDNNSVNWNAGYRLPTEAEWEKAARGGASGQRFPWGDTISWSQANYDAEGLAYDLAPPIGFDPAFNEGVEPYTSPAGYFAPNGYGLYDMAGNVEQWCWDCYGPYSSGSETDPRGLTSGSFRVYRGGNYAVNAFFCRTAFRSNNPSDYCWRNLGFRSILAASQ